MNCLSKVTLVLLHGSLIFSGCRTRQAQSSAELAAAESENALSVASEIVRTCGTLILRDEKALATKSYLKSYAVQSFCHEYRDNSSVANGMYDEQCGNKSSNNGGGGAADIKYKDFSFTGSGNQSKSSTETWCNKKSEYLSEVKAIFDRDCGDSSDYKESANDLISAEKSLPTGTSAAVVACIAHAKDIAMGRSFLRCNMTRSQDKNGKIQLMGSVELVAGANIKTVPVQIVANNASLSGVGLNKVTTSADSPEKYDFVLTGPYNFTGTIKNESSSVSFMAANKQATSVNLDREPIIAGVSCSFMEPRFPFADCVGRDLVNRYTNKVESKNDSACSYAPSKEPQVVPPSPPAARTTTRFIELLAGSHPPRIPCQKQNPPSCAGSECEYYCGATSGCRMATLQEYQSGNYALPGFKPGDHNKAWMVKGPGTQGCRVRTEDLPINPKNANCGEFRPNGLHSPYVSACLCLCTN